MFEEYFVLTAEQCFGVFRVSAPSYPEELLKNLQDTVVMVGRDEIKRYLLNHPNVGRNVLNQCEFRFPQSVGRVYHPETKRKRKSN